MSPVIIGILGKAGSGKSTLAAHLVNRHGATAVSYADPLRAMASAINPIVSAEPSGFSDEPGVVVVRRYNDVVASHGYAAAKALFPEVRSFLQVLGTEGGRDVLGQNVWVDAAMKTISAMTGTVVVADVRFLNEAEAIIENNGFLVRVIRPGLTSLDAHRSETQLDDYPTTYTVHNSTTIFALSSAAQSISKVAEAYAHTSGPAQGASS